MNTNFKKNRDVAVQKRKRRGKGINLGTVMEAGRLCQARGNLMAHIRHAEKGGGAVRMRCAYCGKPRTKFVCKLCGANLCMAAPVHINIPDSNPPRKYREDGLYCFHLWHGYKKWSDLD